MRHKQNESINRTQTGIDLAAHRRYLEQGFSLIELMIGIALGLILVAAVSTIFVSSSRGYKEDDRFARMQENGRFAINTLLTDMSMAYFWGTVPDPTGITSAIGANCGLTFTASDSITFLNNPGSASAVNTKFSCIDTAKVWTGSSTLGDVIAIKRVVGETTAASSSTDAGVYLEINGTSGALVSTSPSAFVSGRTYWKYAARIYYIRKYSVVTTDGIPTLCRVEVSGTTFSNEVCLVEGVENIQIEFGIDIDGDGVPNKYAVDPTAAELKQAVSAKVYLLVRSRDRDTAYTNNKIYDLGSVTIDYSGASDNYYRRVFDSTISLRNITNFSQLGSI